MQGEVCPSDEQLVAHVAGDLAEGERDEILSHLDSCEICRQVIVDVLRGTPQQPTDLADTLLSIRNLRAAASTEEVKLPARYRVDRLLGQGGMGRVFAAHDRELDRPVAVKLMRAGLASAGVAERLVRESRAMAKLNHPGVVTVYDVGRHEGRVYFAMELVDGVTLQQWLRMRRRGWREIVDVFCRAGEGLAAAHAAGLIHRDVKPENVLLALDGERVRRVAVSDFGVARAAVETDTPSGAPAQAVDLTATGVAIGTPAYMAPEQLEGRAIDMRADVFGFGVSLWEALWGGRPYRGRTVVEITAAMAEGPPTPPAGGPPRYVATAVRAAIEPDRDKRPASMAAMLAMLDPARRDRKWLVALVAGIAVAGLAGATVVPRLLRGAPPRPALCDDAGLAETWTDVARGKIRAALGALPDDVAKSLADRAVAAGDGYAQRWSDARIRICALDDPRRRAAAAGCLAARRSALAKLVELVPAMKRVDQVQLDLVFGKLPSVELCETDAAQLVVRDLAPELQPRVAALEDRLGETAALVASGDRESARKELDAMASDVAAIGNRSLVAEHAFARASAASDADPDARIALYQDAAIAAGKAARDDLAAGAWLVAAGEYTHTKNDAKRAADALAQADGAITRGGDVRALRARYLLVLAQLRLFQSKLDDAAKLLADLRLRVPRDAPQLATDLEETEIHMLIVRGQLSEAVAAARALVAERTKRLGETHKDAIVAHQILGNALLVSGDLDATLVETRVGVELARRGFGDDSDSYALALRNLAVVLESFGKSDDAIAAVRKAREILIKTRGPRSFMVADTFQSEARTLATSGKQAQALPLYEQAIAIYKDINGGRGVHAGEAMLSYGTTLAQLGRGADAIAATHEAVALFKAVYGDDNPRYAYARSVLGEALIRAHDNAAARIELEAAVAIFSRSPFAPTLVAAAKFNLAQALAPDPEQHARAIDLAKAALAVFEAAGPPWADVVKHIKDWLAKGGKD